MSVNELQDGEHPNGLLDYLHHRPCVIVPAQGAAAGERPSREVWFKAIETFRFFAYVLIPFAQV